MAGDHVSLSAAARALSIPEVLGMAFSLCEKYTLAASSSVSAFLSDVAVAYLWRDLDTLIPVLELLAPMEHGSVKDVTGYRLDAWAHRGDAVDFKWDRFQRYASHVKSLTVSETHTALFTRQNSTITESTWTSIRLTQPPGTVLLPSLKRLRFVLSDRFDIYSILPLVSPGLVELSLSLSYYTPAVAVRRLLHTLVHRTADLQTLTFSSKCPAVEIGRVLADWITRTPKLKDVTLPRFYHTKEVLEALGRLESLETLWTDCLFRQYHRKENALLAITGSAFPKLRRVTLDIAPLHAVQLLQTSPSWSRITELGLSWQERWDRGELLQFIDVFSTVCVNATKLNLNLPTQNNAATFQVELSHLNPLFRYTRLTALEFFHKFPFLINFGDFEEMGTAWPEIGTLFLCPEFYKDLVNLGYETSMQLPPSLAARFPKLRELRLYVHQAPFVPDGTSILLFSSVTSAS